jgi:hypothetical protein
MPEIVRQNLRFPRKPIQRVALSLGVIRAPAPPSRGAPWPISEIPQGLPQIYRKIYRVNKEVIP